MPIQDSTLNHRLLHPNKLFEALAAGVPIVASDLPELRRIVMEDPAGPLGVLCDPTDPASIAGSIAGLLGRPTDERAALRERCLGAARDRWNWETESARWSSCTRTWPRRAHDRSRDDARGKCRRNGRRHVQRHDRSGSRGSPVVDRPAACGLRPLDARAPRFAEPPDRRHARGPGPPGYHPRPSRPGVGGRRCGPGRRCGVPGLAGGYRVVRVGAPPAARTSHAEASLGRVRGEVERLAGIGLALRRQVREAAAVDPGADLYHGMAYQGIRSRSRSHAALAPGPCTTPGISTPSRATWPGCRRPFVRSPAFFERRWARGFDGIITVNDELATILAGRFDRPLPAVVMNCLPAWTPPSRPDRRFHALLGLAPETRVVLYHGGFLPSRGIDVLATAVLSVRGVALVLMGDGPLRPTLARLAGEPRADGRVHVLPPVPPAELVPWIAAADVGVMVNQPISRNERISTPNKLFECLAAGVPVVSSDFPARRRIVIDDPDGPLGAVCDPTDPVAIAAALRVVLDRSTEETADLRRRVLAAAHARWTWERQAATLLEVYGRLTGRPW